MKSQEMKIDNGELYLTSRGIGYTTGTKKISDNCGTLMFIHKNEINYYFVQIKPKPTAYEGESIDMFFEDGDALVDFVEANFQTI